MPAATIASTVLAGTAAVGATVARGRLLAVRCAQRCRPALRRPLLALAAGALGLLTTACSSLPGVGASAPPPVLKLEVAAPSPLDELLATYLDLGRVNRLAAGEPLQQGELDRLITAAPSQARELLDTEGYYNAEVTVRRLEPGTAASAAAASSPAAGAAAATPAATLTPTPAAAAIATTTAGPLPVVRVEVQPGPRTVVGQIDLGLRGPLAEAAAASPPLPHAVQTERLWREEWPLKSGQAFRDADWSRAKVTTLARLRAEAYVDAEWASTVAIVDARTQRADLTLVALSGPLFRVGPLRVSGLSVHDESTVANIANLDPGAPATESLLLDIQERLQRADLFDRASVALAPDPADPGATAVLVSLSERKLQEASFGVGVSANVGPRMTVDYTHRRPFGKPWLLGSKISLSNLERLVEGELRTQTLPGLYRNLVGGSLASVESGTDTVTGARLRAGRAQDTRRIDRLLVAQWDHSQTRSALGHQRSDALGMHFHGVWRNLDDLLLPTLGYALTGQVAAGVARSDPGGKGPFTRAYARVDGFYPIGKTWFGQARLELGQGFPRAGVVLPEALRFRAGGDGSVRGYQFRSLTPIVNGVEVGGDVLFTASVEVARPILARIPQLWGAVFIDAGRAADTWRQLKPALGVGVGVRYRSPVGPLKLDLAYGEEARRLRLHLTVGVAF